MFEFEAQPADSKSMPNQFYLHSTARAMCKFIPTVIGLEAQFFTYINTVFIRVPLVVSIILYIHSYSATRENEVKILNIFIFRPPAEYSEGKNSRYSVEVEKETNYIQTGGGV
jgi:hypothetical protein